MDIKNRILRPRKRFYSLLLAKNCFQRLQGNAEEEQSHDHIRVAENLRTNSNFENLVENINLKFSSDEKFETGIDDRQICKIVVLTSKSVLNLSLM